jgi:hypothetical protein
MVSKKILEILVSEPFEYEIDTNFEYSPFKNQSQLPVDPNDKRFSTPSSNVPGNFTEPAGYRTYKDPATGSTYYDNPLLDSRLNEVEKDRLHDNLDYTTSLDYELTITKPVNPYLANDANEVLVKKDTIWDNISKATAALALKNPNGKIDKPTILKAVGDTIGSSLNTAMGVVNIASSVQNLVEGVVNYLSTTKDFDLGPDIPSSGELLDIGLRQFGIEAGANYQEIERNVQKDFSRSFNKAYKQDLITEEQYAQLNGKYMDFLAGVGNGVTSTELQKAINPTLDDQLQTMFGQHHGQFVTPEERSKILLDNIVADYHMGTVTKGSVLDAVSSHQQMLNGVGAGVTGDIYTSATSKGAPFMMELSVDFGGTESLLELTDHWKLDTYANLINPNIEYNFDFDRLLPIDSNDAKYDEFKQFKEDFQSELDTLSAKWGTAITDSQLANLPENTYIKFEAMNEGNQAFNDYLRANGTPTLSFSEYKELLENPTALDSYLTDPTWGAITFSRAEQVRTFLDAEARAFTAFQNHYQTQYDFDEQLVWYYTNKDSIESYEIKNPLTKDELRVDNYAINSLIDNTIYSGEGVNEITYVDATNFTSNAIDAFVEANPGAAQDSTMASVLNKDVNTVTANEFATAYNVYTTNNPDAVTATSRQSYASVLDHLNLKDGLQEQGFSGNQTFSIADAVEISNPLITPNMGEININNYISIDLRTGEIIDKVQEGVTALNVGAQGLVGSIQTPTINLSEGGAEYTPVGELNLDTKFDINTFQVPQFEVSGYFDGQALPALPKKEGYEEAAIPKRYEDEYPYGSGNITLDATNSQEFYEFQKEQYDAAIDYFKNEVQNIDFNYATSPEQVGQAILGVMVDMNEKGIFQFTQFPDGPEEFVINANRSTYGAYGSGYNGVPPIQFGYDPSSEWYGIGDPATQGFNSPTGVMVNSVNAVNGESSKDVYKMGYNLRPAVWDISTALDDLFNTGETFGGYVKTGNQEDFSALANSVFKPINKVLVDSVLDRGATMNGTEKDIESYMVSANQGIYAASGGDGTNFIYTYKGQTDENKANFYDEKKQIVRFTDDAAEYLKDLLIDDSLDQGGFDAPNIQKGDIVMRFKQNYDDIVRSEEMGFGQTLFYQGIKPGEETDEQRAIYQEFLNTGVNPDPGRYVAMDMYSKDGKKLDNKALVDLTTYQNMPFNHSEASFPGSHVFQTRQFTEADPNNRWDQGITIMPGDFEKEIGTNSFGLKYTPVDTTTTLVYNTFYPNQSNNLNLALNRPDDFVHPYTKAISDIVLDTRFQDEIKSLENSVKTAEAEILKLQGDLDDADNALNKATTDLDTANKALNKAADDLANVPPDQTDALNAAMAAKTKAEQERDQANLFFQGERTKYNNLKASFRTKDTEYKTLDAQYQDLNTNFLQKEIEINQANQVLIGAISFEDLTSELAKNLYTNVETLNNDLTTANQAKTDAQSALATANTNHQAAITQINKEKNAAIAAAQAGADEAVAAAQAQAQKDIEDAEAKAIADVAAKQNELDVKQSELNTKQGELDTAQANLQAQINFELPEISQYSALDALGFQSVNVLNKRTGEMVEYRVSPGHPLSTEPSDGLTHGERKKKAVDDYMAQIDPAFLNETNETQIRRFMNDMVGYTMSREFWKNDSIYYQNQIVDIEAKAATDLANAISQGQTDVDAKNAEIKRIEAQYDGQIVKLNYDHRQEVLELNGSITTAEQNAATAQSNFEAEEAKFKAKKAEFDALVLERDQIDAARKAADAKNIQLTTANEGLITSMAKQDSAHATALNQAKSDYDTQLTNKETELQSQYQDDLNARESELETKYNNDLATETTRLETEAQGRLDAQKLELEAERDRLIAEARADEQLIASGNLAIREKQLEDKYKEDLAAANSLSAKLLSEAVADETTRMQLLADEALLQQKNTLEAKYAADLQAEKTTLQQTYQANLDQLVIGNNTVREKLIADHSKATSELTLRLENEKDDAVQAEQDKSSAALVAAEQQYAEDLAKAKQDAKDLYEEQLQERLGVADADAAEAARLAKEAADALLESETARLEGIRAAEQTRITEEFEAAAQLAEDQFKLDKKALSDTNALLEQTIIDLTPPPPLHLGADGEDYRIKDAGETAFIDKLLNEKHSRTNKIVFLPTMFKYENNVVYDPGGFNDEDLFISDTIQELYYQGFPTTTEGMQEFVLNNKEFFPDFDENGLPIEAQNTLIESIQNGIMDAGFFLQTFTGGKINTTLLNAMGVLLAGGVPLGNILNAAGDIFGPDNAIELVGVLARQINHGREFGENKEVGFKAELDEALVKENIEFYDPDDYDDPLNPFYGMDEDEVDNNTTVINTGTGTVNQGPGGTSVTGNVNYSDVDLGDPTDYLYQILRYIEGPEVAERFKGKGMSDPEGFELISKYLDQTTLDNAIRTNLISEASLFGTDEQRGSIEIGAEASQKIQDIAQALRDDQALSNIELVEKYGERAAEAIRSLDPDRLEQQSILQELSKKRLNEALNFTSTALPIESLLEQTAEDLIGNLKDETVIEQAVKAAAMGQLDPALTESEALMKQRGMEFLKSTGKLTPLQELQITENIATGLAKRGRLDSTFGLKEETKGRIEAELDKEKNDITFGTGLIGTFENMYGDRLLRGAGLGATASQLEATRGGENRADIALANNITGQLYNYQNNRINQQTTKDSIAAQLQNQYDTQSAQYTGDIFNFIGTTSPYGGDVLSGAIQNNVQGQSLGNLTSIAAADAANAQNFASTMEGIAALRTGATDYSNLLSSGMRGYTSASQTGSNNFIPGFSNNFQGYGDLSFGEKVGVINQSIGEANDFFATDGGLDTLVGNIKGGLTGDPKTNIFDEIMGIFDRD